VHFEIGCKDREKTTQFFSDLFGWKMETAGIASMVNPGEGITGLITALGHEPHHYTTFYVQVDDVRASLDKVEQLGGKVVVPPVKIPTGQFAWFSDPEGNIIGLWKPA
jgi:predicted enzyme related to lactoylglutathione lyase